MLAPLAYSREYLLRSEKAQAIMILAGNGSFLGCNKNLPSPQVQSPIIKVPSNVVDGVFPMQPLSSQPHAHMLKKTNKQPPKPQKFPLHLKIQVQQVMSNQEAVDCINTEKDAKFASKKKLIDFALSRRSSDDISVIVCIQDSRSSFDIHFIDEIQEECCNIWRHGLYSSYST